MLSESALFGQRWSLCWAIRSDKDKVELDVVIYAAGGGRNGSSKIACVQAQLSSCLGIYCANRTL